jgi:tRNA pseudouridine38-40 synthase
MPHPPGRALRSRFWRLSLISVDPEPTPPESESDERRTRRLLIVAYNGAPWSGFQQQANAPSVAGALDEAIRRIDPGASKVLGSSRTDAGVHARFQPVTFDTTRTIASRGWLLALTSHLPRSIAVLRTSEVSRDFDPRTRPLWKEYRYTLLRSAVEDPFLTERAWRIGHPLDLDLMRREAESLVGEHDFAAFRSSADPRTTTVRHLARVAVEESQADPRLVEIVVRGNRFLYNMVRIIAGTLVDVGRGHLAPGAVERALESKNRLQLGMTAPARGLCLCHVELPDWGQAPWPEAPILAPA